MMDSEFFSQVYAQLATQVRTKLAGADGSHDFDHTQRVLRNAEQLGRELPEADMQIVRLAALLHDIARPEETASQGSICHAKLGAELIRPMLNALKVPSEDIERVVQAVLTHRYRDGRMPVSLEAKLVYDADKLDSVGAVGIGRAFLFAGRVGARLHNTQEEALSSQAYSAEDTAYREYLVKLSKLPDCMLTVPGKRIAKERSAFMQEFFEQLSRETGLY